MVDQGFGVELVQRALGDHQVAFGIEQLEHKGFRTLRGVDAYPQASATGRNLQFVFGARAKNAAERGFRHCRITQNGFAVPEPCLVNIQHRVQAGLRGIAPVFARF